MANQLLPNATQYKDLVSQNADMKAKVWASLVLPDARSKNVLKRFIGKENSGLPIIEKTQLSKGQAEEIVFTTVAPVRGQGVLGENTLSGNEHKLEFGTFKVGIDLLRHAVAFTQLVGAFRELSPEQISAKVMTEWYGRKEEDDIQIRLRNKALLTNPENLLRIGNHDSQDALTSADVWNTTMIEQAASILSSMGGNPLKIDTDAAGADNVQYLLFGPDSGLKPLKRNPFFAKALREAGLRGDKNALFAGGLPMWDNNLIFSHRVIVDTANGRQGSPLAPIAFLGTPIADESVTTITGGGERYAAGSGDYFAYFGGYGWKLTDNENLPADNNTYYAIIYNTKGPNKGKYEGISWTAVGNDGNKLTSVTREVATIIATNDARFTNAHASGAMIIPCTKYGVPLCYSIMFGQEALFYAKGGLDGGVTEAEPIFEYADYKNRKGKAHLTGVGMQGVRGMEPYRDTIGRLPNFLVIEHTRVIPGVELNEYVGSS